MPAIRLFTAPVLVDRGSLFAPEYEEVEAPLIALSFDYGGTRVRASEPGGRLFRGSGADLSVVDRNPGAEARARYVLESLGAVELECLEHYVCPAGAADYVVEPEGDVHAVCAFSAYAVPQLESMGWTVAVDEDYPWQVVGGPAPWYADLDAQDRADWFSLELGVELDGERINLLPALLELLQDASSLQQLLRKRRRCVALPVGQRRFLPVPVERLRTVADVVLELYGGGSRRALSFPAIQAPALARLDEAFHGPGPGGPVGVLSWSGEVAPRARAQVVATRAPASAPPPAELHATLRPYQEAGLSWLQHLRTHGVSGILADDMGLGKTLQTIAHLLVEHRRQGVDRPSLVVAPTSVVGNWQRELGRFAPALRVAPLWGPGRSGRYRELPRCDVALTTYPLLLRDRQRLLDQPLHLLVLDEAQQIKNPRSQTHRAARELDARHRLCLTGTPLENHLGELWSLFDFLMPGFLGDARNFRTLYRQPIEVLGASERMVGLRQRVAPFVLRRTKEEVVRELPPKTEIVRAVELRGAQRELYESIRIAAHAQVRRAIAERGIARSTITILDALMKLRQACCDPRLVNISAARPVQGSAKRELLFELLQRQLQEGRRILVFSQFTSMLRLIAQGLVEREVRHLALTGATVHRQAMVDAFQAGRADVFLISLKAGGTGLNLTGADTVIHYDPWWNPAAQAQATDRAHRIGQSRPVFVYNLIVAGSVEERMLALQQRKRELAHSLLSTRAGVELSERELEDLLAPLPDAEGGGPGAG